MKCLNCHSKNIFEFTDKQVLKYAKTYFGFKILKLYQCSKCLSLIGEGKGNLIATHRQCNGYISNVTAD